MKRLRTGRELEDIMRRINTLVYTRLVCTVIIGGIMLSFETSSNVGRLRAHVSVSTFPIDVRKKHHKISGCW
jgi:hypothetical protein